MQMSTNQMSEMWLYFSTILRYAADQKDSEMYVGVYNPAKPRDI